MFNIKSIVNKITDRGRDSSIESPSEEDAASHRTEGFLCPKCMKQLPSPWELQSHYEHAHGEDASVQSLPGVQESVTSQDDEYGDDQEMSACGEGINSSLSAEDVPSITNVQELQERLQKALNRRAILESKVVRLVQSNVTLKGTVEERDRELIQLKDRLKILESQLAHRESIDDAAVLRQELVQVQRVMDEMNRERERERDELQAKLIQLQERNEVEILNESLKTSLNLKEEECNKVSKELAELKHKCDDLECELEKEKLKSKLSEQHRDTINALGSIGSTGTQGAFIHKEEGTTDSENYSNEQPKDIYVSQNEELQKVLESKNSDLIILRTSLDELKEELSRKNEELSNVRSEMDLRNKEHDAQIKELKLKLNILTETDDVTKRELVQKQDELSKIQDELRRKNNSRDSQIKEMEEKQKELIISHDILKEKLKKKEDELKTKQDELISFMEKNEAQVKEMEAERRKLTEKLNKKERMSVDLSEEMKKLKEEKLLLESKLNKSQEEYSAAQIKVSDLQKSLNELQREFFSVQTEHEQEQQQLRTTIQEKSELLQKQDAAVQLLVSERTEFVRQLETLEKNKTSELEEASQKIDNLQAELAEKSKKEKQLESSLLFETQKGHSLLEKLNELKESSSSVIEAKNKEIKDLKMSLDETSGEKLALEAQLETTNSEQQKVLERWYASTSEIDNLKHSVSDLRRKWEESESALQDLGRENATLQLDIEKLLARKWAEDADVTECTLCHREFTMLIRKHHCRNCGQIFCNECSSKTAAVVSNKKPVRVCDSCCTELQRK